MKALWVSFEFLTHMLHGGMMVQEEQSKQKKKLGRLELGSSAEALSAWCQRIPQLKKYAPLFETRGVTGERMRAMASDQELEDLGMALWISKKCKRCVVQRIGV